MIHYFDNENVPQVWNDAGVNIRYLNSSLFGTTSYNNYLDLIKNLTSPHIQRLGYDPIPDEPATDSQLRNSVKQFNCNSLDSNCLNHELEKLKRFKDDATSPAPDFCSAFRLADSSTYYHFLVQMATNPSFAYRSAIVRTIQCSLDQNLLSDLLEVIDDPENILTTNERNTLVNYMFVTSTIGFRTAFEYLKENLSKFETFRSQVIATINSQEVFDELKEVLELGIGSGLIRSDIAESTIAAIGENMKWQERNYEGISSWFDLLLNGITTTSSTSTTTTTTTTTTKPPTPPTTPTLPTPPNTGPTTTGIPQPPTPMPTSNP
jgi:ERAP1-like C-terminal domain